MKQQSLIIRSRHHIAMRSAIVWACFSAALASAQIIPPPPQTVSRQNVARAHSYVHGNSQKSVHDYKSIPYSPQAGWRIVSYNVVDEGSFGTCTENHYSVPGNYTFVSSSDMTNAFNAAYN